MSQPHLTSNKATLSKGITVLGQVECCTRALFCHLSLRNNHLPTEIQKARVQQWHKLIPIRAQDTMQTRSADAIICRGWLNITLLPIIGTILMYILSMLSRAEDEDGSGPQIGVVEIIIIVISSSSCCQGNNKYFADRQGQDRDQGMGWE